MTSPIIERHPLDHSGVAKIALGQTASDALAALGPCLVVLSKADSTAPEALQGRSILLCLPSTKDVLDACYGIASGTHKASRIRASNA